MSIRPRASVVWEALEPLLADGPDRLEPHRPLDVLDIGGGTGGFAVRIAQLGHQVTVVDPNPDALAALARRANDAGIAVEARQGDLLSMDMSPASVDVVLCHGVLEVVPDPAAALARITDVLRPGGFVSLVVSQRYAAVIARAMAGHIGEALALLEGDQSGGRGGHRFTRDEAAALVAAAGLELTEVHGARVFGDLIPGALQDADHHATAALASLERAVSTMPEFLALATQLHLIAKRPYTNGRGQE